MAESKGKLESLREWVSEHKLRTVDQPFVYVFSHREFFVDEEMLHAQALTLAALAGAAVVEYYEHKSGAKAERYAKFLPVDNYSHKD
ncbi:hypothetical protein SDJN02_15010, partial [Cucurbita argyrosperma subsp. argyrosperma]